jgi:feruloyl esterase
MKRSLMIVIPILATTLVGATAASAPTGREGGALTGAENVSCEGLTSFSITGGTITSVEVVEAGAFTPPTAPGARPASGPAVARTYGGLPAFCRLIATLRPTDASNISVELWMPLSGWNNKYQAVGNGAFRGSIGHSAMAAALASGYATSSTDTGHIGNTARFGMGHPELVVDFGWRSVHLMAVVAKDVIAAHYDEGPRYSYWNGCSAGGRQAMKLAQRFPADFDGIVAGAPGQDWTGRAAGALRVAKHLELNEAARLSEDDRRLVHSAALAACDAADGVEGGIIDSPQSCTFDPAVLQCSGAKDGSCLTPAQVGTVRMLYSSPVNPSTNRQITGLLPGSELSWTDLGWTNSARATGLDQYRYLVYGDPTWTIDRFDFDTDIVKAEQVDDETLNALDPDLQPFFARGGKLLAYHGWSDAQISPLNATQYYERVVESVGSADEVHDSYRLFMAPGMGHCRGGEGPSDFDKMGPLEAWVERGQAPDRVVATRFGSQGEVEMRRPLCAYPARAVDDGNGDPRSDDSFSCARRE